MIKFVKCVCKNSYQDEKYGKGVRVANSRNKKNGQPTDEYRCTVCKSIHVVS